MKVCDETGLTRKLTLGHIYEERLNRDPSVSAGLYLCTEGGMFNIKTGANHVESAWSRDYFYWDDVTDQYCLEKIK